MIRQEEAVAGLYAIGSPDIGSHELQKVGGEFITCQWGAGNRGGGIGLANLELWLMAIWEWDGRPRTTVPVLVEETLSRDILPGEKQDLAVIYIIPTEVRFTFYAFRLLVRQTSPVIVEEVLNTHDFANMYP